MNFIRNLGPTELIIIGVILVLIFGKKKLSEWAQGLGESTREVKKIKKEFQDASNPESNNEKPKEKEGEGVTN